jgi:hypothetical protein
VITVEQIEQRCRQHRPHAVVIIAEGRDDQPINMRRGRSYAQVARIIYDLLSAAAEHSNARAELRERDGSVMAVIIANEDRAGNGTPRVNLSAIPPEQQAYLAFMDHVLDRFTTWGQGVLDAQVRALDALAKRAEVSERTIERLMRTTYETTVSASHAVSEATMALAEREQQIAADNGGPLAPALNAFGEAVAKRMGSGDKKPPANGTG